jgi:hypothetical protein
VVYQTGGNSFNVAVFLEMAVAFVGMLQRSFRFCASSSQKQTKLIQVATLSSAVVFIGVS